MHQITIVKKQSECFIEPPHTSASRREEVKFRAVNIAAGKVIINFPGFYPFTGNAEPIILDKNTPVVKEIIDSEDVYGTHPFSAYCEECNAFAVGGSFGELIVGP